MSFLSGRVILSEFPKPDWARRCFWYPERGSMDEIGVNSRNMDPEDLKYITRKIDFDVVGTPLRDQATAHPQDRARY